MHGSMMRRRVEALCADLKAKRAASGGRLVMSACRAVARGRAARLRRSGFGAAAFTRYASEGWWAREDSNLQPSGYEPLALTIELRARPFRPLRQSRGRRHALWTAGFREKALSDASFQ